MIAQPPPRLACADSSFPRLSHAGSLAVIRDLGIDAVDICVFAGYANNPPRALVEAPERLADEVGARVAEHGLEISDVFGIFGESFETLAVNHPDQQSRAESMRHFEALVEFARRLSAPGVTILPGTQFPGIEPEQSLALAASELELRARLAGEAGLRFSIEPHVGSIAATPDWTLTLLERAENVQLTLDLSHFVFAGITQEEVYPLLPRTAHVHLRQAGPGRIQTRLREGTIDFPALLRQLLDRGYAGHLAFEYQWEEGDLDFSHVDCITETAELRDLILDD